MLFRLFQFSGLRKPLRYQIQTEFDNRIEIDDMVTKYKSTKTTKVINTLFRMYVHVMKPLEKQENKNISLESSFLLRSTRLEPKHWSLCLIFQPPSPLLLVGPPLASVWLLFWLLCFARANEGLSGFKFNFCLSGLAISFICRERPPLLNSKCQVCVFYPASELLWNERDNIFHFNFREW